MRWPRTPPILLGWTVAAAAASSVLIVWLAILNFFYLMTQMVVAIEDVSVRTGGGMALAFVWGHLREVAGVFGVVLIMVVIATAASILATAGLGLIAFVPLVGLAVLPLQLAAWLVRGIVFEYLALAALGAYLSHYRWYHSSSRHPTSHDQYRFIPLQRRAPDAGVRDPQDGHRARQRPRRHLVCTGLSGARTFPWDEFAAIAARAARQPRRARPAVRPDARLPAAARRHRGDHAQPRHRHERSRPAGHDRIAAGAGSRRARAIDPGDVILVELPTYVGAITAFRNVQAQMVGVPQEARRHRSRGARRRSTHGCARKAAASSSSMWCRTSRTPPDC